MPARCGECGGQEWSNGSCAECRTAPTLGDQVADLIESACVIPDGERAGEAFTLTEEQLRFLLHFYRLDPLTGRFTHFRGAQLVRPQKWGKGPFSAAIVIAEAHPEGPVLFDGWDADGQPVGKPWPTPWVQITAASEDQTDNVWRALQPMVEMSPTLAAEIPDTGQTRINLHGGGRIEPVTSSARSRLGARITFALEDETHSWLESNGGRRLADTQRRNLAGMGGRWMETTNAWDPAEESVAQQTAEGSEPGVYRDDSEPGAGSVRNARDRRRLLRQVYGDSLRTRENPLGWIDLDRIEGEIMSLLDRDPAQAERFFLNRKEAGESIAFNIERWDELATDHEAPAGELIVVGVDGARSRDALAMVACEVTTGHVWPLGIWERPEDAPPDYEHDRDEIDHAMREAMKRWSVWRVYVDPQHIEALLDRWQGRWGQDRVVPWYTARARQIAWAVRNFSEAIGAGDLSHDGDPVLRDHIRNSRRLRLNVRDDKGVAMHAISKDRSHSPRKIDGAMGAILAWEARGDAIAAGATAQKKRSRRLVAW